jgi:hypothetical protein
MIQRRRVSVRRRALADDAALRLAELADFLCRVWHLPDAGIWELRRPHPRPRRPADHVR